jgi:hypothetical protein
MIAGSNSGLVRACLAAATLFLTAATANATLIYVDDTGASVGAPAVGDGSQEAVWFTETAIGDDGQYDVHNNTTGYSLLAIGISNNDTSAWVGSFFDNFDCDMGWCYESLNLDASNWAIEEIDFEGNTGFDIFGDISNVLDPGDNTINFYRANDGDIGPGESWDGFLFTAGVPSSQLFVVLSPQGMGDTVYGSGGTPVVPEPSTGLLLLGGMLGMRFVSRRK